MKVLFPMHVGSGNRGCEGIIRGTYDILKPFNTEFYLLDKDKEDYILDKKLEMDKIGKLILRAKNNIIIKFMKKIGFLKKEWNINPYKNFLKLTDNDSLVVFSGGDLYCYKETIETNYYILNYLNKIGVPAILWGASINTELLSKEVIEQMKSFKAIICRESLSYQNMKKEGFTNNLFLIPDPAFCLKPIECDLPDLFNDNEVIGINLSPMINGGEDNLDSLMGKNIIALIQYILDTSTRNILLIPHVTWNKQDDRKICNFVKNRFKSERISILDVSDLNYLQIRYIISKCSLFIGARTHSIVSAYSTCVPSIAIGYSIKSKGIAKDLGLKECLVFDSKNIKNEDELVNLFKYLDENSQTIKKHLGKVIPPYSLRCYEAGKIFGNIIGEQ